MGEMRGSEKMVPIKSCWVYLLCVAGMTLTPNHASAQGDKISVDALLGKLDGLYRSQSSEGVMSMTVVTAHYKRTLKMTMTTRGQEDTLIRILSPRKEKRSFNSEAGQ